MKKINFNLSKLISRIAFVVTFAWILYFGLSNSGEFEKHNSLTISLITLLYVFLTFEMLRENSEAKPLPYIVPSFLVCNTLDDFIEKYPKVKLTRTIKQLLENPRGEESPEKNYLFVRMENIGETTGVDVKLHIKYSKKDLMGEVDLTERVINYGTMKNGDDVIDIIETFESPSRSDTIKLKKCLIEYNTVNGKYHAEGSQKNEYAHSASCAYDEESKISFKNLSD